MYTERKELFVLKCWCCIVPVLGEVKTIYTVHGSKRMRHNNCVHHKLPVIVIY